MTPNALSFHKRRQQEAARRRYYATHFAKLSQFESLTREPPVKERGPDALDNHERRLELRTKDGIL